MGVPTITSITPTTGPTRGRALVRIVGTNFQLSPAPPPSGRAPPVNPSVEVLFGTALAREVHVLSAGLLHVVSPIHDPVGVAVTVRNIDQAGVLIPGETVTTASATAYTFGRPDLNKTGHEEGVIARVCRTLIREIKRQVIANVELTVHVDYDDTTGDGMNVAMLATLPGIVLSGPRLRENRFYWTNAKRQITVDGATYEQRPSRCVDVLFTVIGAHDTMQTNLNFLQEVISFFETNTTLPVLSNPTVPGDFTDFEMEIEDDFSMTGTSNNSNIRSFSGSVVIRGVELDDADMAIQQVFDVQDVIPTGAVQALPGQPGEAPWPFILTGLPGTTPAAPIPANPPAVVGNAGPIEQIPPPEDD